MVVLERLADALLEVGRGDDLQVLGEAERAIHGLARGRDRDEAEAVDAPLDAAVDHDLEAPALAVLGQRDRERVGQLGTSLATGQVGRLPAQELTSE